eukprot:6194600-Pleurochrysis_carterae.AAC.1
MTRGRQQRKRLRSMTRWSLQGARALEQSPQVQEQTQSKCNYASPATATTLGTAKVGEGIRQIPRQGDGRDGRGGFKLREFGKRARRRLASSRKRR